MRLSRIVTGTSFALLGACLFVSGCGEQNIQTEGYKNLKEKIKAEVKSEFLSELTGVSVADSGPVESDSSCVSCHTDKEKLKFESAGIKRPPASALTSGKG